MIAKLFGWRTTHDGGLRRFAPRLEALDDRMLPSSLTAGIEPLDSKPGGAGDGRCGGAIGGNVIQLGGAAGGVADPCGGASGGVIGD